MNFGEVGSEEPLRVVLSWPPQEDLLRHRVQGYVVLRRLGGILLVLPDQVLDEEAIIAASTPTAAGVEPLIGVVSKFDVAMVTVGDAGELEVSEEAVPVLAMDMSLPAAAPLLAAYMEDDEEVDLINHFLASDPAARPNFADLIPKIKLWLEQEVDRPDFYTADEGQPSAPSGRVRPKGSSPEGSTGPGGKAPPGAKAPLKKATVASLAVQMQTLMDSLPVITSQLQDLSRRQESMERRQAVEEEVQPIGGFRPVISSRTAAPVSGLLASQPKTSMPGLMRMVGAPPPVRSSPTMVLDPDLDGAPLEREDPRNEVLENPMAMSPMTQALMEQTRALTLLMGHFQASNDPMSDLASSTPTTGVKGTIARERLQRELSMGSGAFFLKVCQNISKRASPTLRPPSERQRNPQRVVVGLPREVWRVRSAQRARYGSMVPGVCLRRCYQGRMGLRKGPSCFDLRNGGAGQPRWESVELGMVASVAGRPSSEPVDE